MAGFLLLNAHSNLLRFFESGLAGLEIAASDFVR